MLTRTYRKLEVGEVVTFVDRGSTTSLIRALLPSLAMATYLYDATLYVAEVGPRVTRTRHRDGCSDTVASRPGECNTCGEGMLVEMDSDIWLVTELEFVGTRKNTDGSVRHVNERRFYHSRTLSGFRSPIDSELLDLEFEDTETEETTEEGS